LHQSEDGVDLAIKEIILNTFNNHPQVYHFKLNASPALMQRFAGYLSK
jgi:hypothetical protein